MSDGKTILVIDDEARICQSFERALGRAGYNVDAFSDPRAALSHLEGGGHVDLVVSDLMMPDKTGTEVLREIRSRGIDVPFVMITGYASTENALETMRLGAVDYLPKPFTVAELKGVVARGLRAGELDRSELPSAPAGTYEIRFHSWVRQTTGDEVLVGVHPIVPKSCGKIVGVELPMEEDEVIQGGPFGKLLTEDSRVPVRLWVPVSGDVKATNPQVVENPSLVAEDPYGAGWLLRVLPSRLEEDMRKLVASGAE